MAAKPPRKALEGAEKDEGVEVVVGNSEKSKDVMARGKRCSHWRRWKECDRQSSRCQQRLNKIIQG